MKQAGAPVENADTDPAKVIFIVPAKSINIADRNSDILISTEDTSVNNEEQNVYLTAERARWKSTKDHMFNSTDLRMD